MWKEAAARQREPLAVQDSLSPELRSHEEANRGWGHSFATSLDLRTCREGSVPWQGPPWPSGSPKLPALLPPAGPHPDSRGKMLLTGPLPKPGHMNHCAWRPQLRQSNLNKRALMRPFRLEGQTPKTRPARRLLLLRPPLAPLPWQSCLCCPNAMGMKKPSLLQLPGVLLASRANLVLLDPLPDGP